MLHITLIFFTLVLGIHASCKDLANCETCSNPGPLCDECPAATVLSENRLSCIPCGVGCSNCTSDESNSVTCTLCSPTFYPKDGACSYCGDGCHACHEDPSGSIVCDKCADEGFVQDLTTAPQPCVACGTNCKTCSLNDDGSTKCSECYSYQGLGLKGFYLKKSDYTCKACPSNCEKCTDNGNGVGVCTSCYAGYEILTDSSDSSKDGSKCIRCPSDCASCSGEEFTSGTARCMTCKPDRGLYLSNGECTMCDVPGACKTCDESGQCTECNKMYRLDSGSCAECSAFCEKCSLDGETGEELCSDCQDGYGPKLKTSYTCDSCGISNCAVCSRDSTGTTSCTTCKTGYGMDSTGKCTACPPGCSACSFTDHWKCTSCKSGYTADVHPPVASSAAGVGLESRCSQCPTGCATCSHDATAADGSVDCLTCSAPDTDYLNTAATDQICTVKPANCDTVDGATGACTTCKPGCKLDASTPVGCEACTATNCATCDTDATKCETCPKYYTLVDADFDNVTDSCEGCGISKCEKCSVEDGYAGNPKKCLTCETGYIVYDSATKSTTEGTSCKKCPAGCISCTVDYNEGGRTKCTTCASWDGKKSYTAGENGICVPCPANCKQCTYDISAGTTACEDNQCDSKFAKNPNSGECEACPEHCTSCDHDESVGSIVCRVSSCSPGYGRVSDGTCAACPNQCSTCSIVDETTADDTLFCDMCMEGFVKNDDVCATCPANCVECQDQSGTMTCSSCKPGYALDSANTCVKCPSNCKSCTAKGVTVCTECVVGYALSADKTACLGCDTAAFENCAVCTDIDSDMNIAHCLSCSTGYVLEDDQRNTSCKDTGALSCGAGSQRDAGPECSLCSDDFTLTKDYKCARLCYACGDVEAGVFVDKDKCVIPDGKNNNTGGQAEVVECLSGVCYAAYRDSKVLAGCLPQSHTLQTCHGDMAAGETCQSTPFDKRCDRCCSSEYCNTFVTTLDGIPDSASNMGISALLSSLSILTAVAMKD